MTAEEREQFEMVIRTFSYVNSYKEDFYIAPFLDMGYITAQYINEDGSIDKVILHRTPKELYFFLEQDWETEWLFTVGHQLGCKEMDNDAIIQVLPEEKKKELKELHARHEKEMASILSPSVLGETMGIEDKK